MPGKSIPYEDDLNQWLQDPDNAAGYLTAVLEENDPDGLLVALRDVAKAHGGMRLARGRTLSGKQHETQLEGGTRCT